MPSCIVKSCKNYASKLNKQDGVHYFHFPRNPVRSAEWRKVIAKSRGDEYFKPKPTDLVCSAHFETSDMYFTENGLRRVKNTAVPKLLLHKASKFVNILQCDNISQNDISPDSSSEDNTIEDRRRHRRTSNMISPGHASKEPADLLENESSASTSSSIERAVATPKEIMLERKLKRCRKLLIVRNKKIINLQKQNQRLIRKNIQLRNASTLFKKKSVQEFVENESLSD